MPRKLKMLCPQMYEGSSSMTVTSCTRCSAGWSKTQLRCLIETGAEHLPDDWRNAPACPIASQCQHGIQQSPCIVQQKGLVCESALVFAGVDRTEAAALERSFNALFVISEEEIQEKMSTYKITRYYSPSEQAKGKEDYVVKGGLSLEEAKKHCQDPKTRKEGEYFDGWREEQDEDC